MWRTSGFALCTKQWSPGIDVSAVGVEQLGGRVRFGRRGGAMRQAGRGFTWPKIAQRRPTTWNRPRCWHWDINLVSVFQAYCSSFNLCFSVFFLPGHVPLDERIHASVNTKKRGYQYWTAYVDWSWNDPLQCIYRSLISTSKYHQTTLCPTTKLPQDDTVQPWQKTTNEMIMAVASDDSRLFARVGQAICAWDRAGKESWQRQETLGGLSGGPVFGHCRQGNLSNYF